MPKEDVAPYQRNLALKQEFQDFQLDINEVMEFTPMELDLENRRLEYLLNFVRQYQQYRSQESMEIVAGSFITPPIYPMISPESDWYRFEQWMQGKPTRLKLSEQISPPVVFRKPEDIGEDEIEVELERLVKSLEQAGYGIGLNFGIPAPLVYAFLYESLGETFEVSESGGGWFFDGCSGYCPDCFQRPWCDSGESSCWSEDEEAGKMYLSEEVQQYVSASPQSLEILRELQAVEDAAFEKFKAENPDPDDNDWDEDPEWLAKQN